MGVHYSDKCPVVSDVNARLESVRKYKLCYKCLGTKHNAKKCYSLVKCFHCKQSNHNSAICQRKKVRDGLAVKSGFGLGFNEDGKDNMIMPKHPDQQTDGRETLSKTTLIAANDNPVFLQTMKVNVADVSGNNNIKANVIFDGGSQKTYLSERLVEKLKLKSVGKQDMKINAFGATKSKLISVEEYNFCLRGKQGDGHYLKGFSVPVICAPLNNCRIDFGKMTIEGVNLRNFLPEDEEIDGEIDVLIGADFYWSLISEEIIRLEENLVLIRSKLGYMLSGPMNVESSHVNCVHVMKVSSALNEQFSGKDFSAEKLDQQVERFWDLDAIGILNDEKSVYELNSEKIEFIDERYQVELPVKDDHPLIQDNFSCCVKRLAILKNNLTKKSSLLESYDEIIQKQIKEGIVELVDDSNGSPDIGNVTYILHHPVVKDEKSTTKVRIVYDCSAKAGEWSLNECLYKGPCLTPLIFDSFIRFRLHDVALIADIESAYLQIAVIPEQRDLLRFLWFRNVSENDFTVQKLRFARVLFGAAPSQYLLNAVIQKHAKNYREVDPKFENMVNSGFYVDDLNISVPNSEDGVDFYHKCKV